MKKIEFNNISKDVLDQIGKGAFLTTKLDEKINTMTIGWATFGIIWGKPIAMVAVRYSRHTYNLIDRANEFTINIPKLNDLKKELGICGRESGRDIDKFEKCNFTIKESMDVKAPLIDECEYNIECKVVYKQAMEPGLVDKNIKEKFYNSSNDYHVLYYGEIINCYKKD